jgi:tetratricopeptide (TPR) repeat protein
MNHIATGFRWTMAVAMVCLLSDIATAQRRMYGASSLPSERLGENIGAVTSASQFTRRGYGAPTGLLAAPFGVSASRFGGKLSPTNLDLGQLRPELVGRRLRSLESFALGERARFAELQKGSLELGLLLAGEKTARPGDLRQAFFQFVFPFGLRDKPEQYDYGYYCLNCLQRGRIKNPEIFLREFTEEAQGTIANKAFLDTVAAVYRTGQPPQGQSLDALYDSQLAAMGNYLFSNGHYPAAADVWSILAARDPTSSLFAQAAGQSLFAAQRFPEASRLLRRSLVTAHGWKNDSLRIGGVNLQDIYHDVGALAEARQVLELALQRTPDDRDLQFLMAYIDLFHGLWDRADARLESLAAGGDRDADGLLRALRGGRVGPWIKFPAPPDGKMSAAEFEQLTTSIALTREERAALVESITHPKTVEDYMHRGDFYFFMGSYPIAAEAYGRAVQMAPDNAIAKFAESHAAFANGEYAYAAKRLKEALAIEPDIGLYNFRLEEFYGDRSQLDRRLRDLEHMTKLRPNDMQQQFLLGYVYYFDGRYTESANTLLQVLTASPDYDVARNLLKLARLQS